MTPGVVDVQAFIDTQPVSWEQKRLLFLCFLVIAIDGFDTAIVGFIAPSIRAEWQLPVTQLGPLFAAGLFGLMLGAFAVGPLADRYGRKTLLVSSMIVFGAAQPRVRLQRWADVADRPALRDRPGSRRGDAHDHHPGVGVLSVDTAVLAGDVDVLRFHARLSGRRADRRSGAPPLWLARPPRRRRAGAAGARARPRRAAARVGALSRDNGQCGRTNRGDPRAHRPHRGSARSQVRRQADAESLTGGPAVRRRPAEGPPCSCGWPSS